MQDYIWRFLLAMIMALCVSLLFLGGKHSQANTLSVEEQTAHWIWPSDGVITDVYGTRHGHHKGIDIAAEFKSPIYAVDKGIVTKSYYSNTYGHVVFLKHGNGFETVYAHLNKRNVKEGQAVKQGEVIGEMGNTGDSSGVHLHFEIHQTEWTFKKENALDPVVVLGDVDIGDSIKAFSGAEDGSMEALADLKKQDKQDEMRRYKTYIHKTSRDNQDRIHVVKQGETLWSISKSYNSQVKVIAALNNLNSNEIFPGQELIVETDSKKKYIVKQGDTLSSISRKMNLSVEVIKQLNGLKSDIIFPRQVLIIN